MCTGDADWDTDSGSDADYGTDTCSIASSTASSNSSAAQQRRKGPLALMTKVLKKKKLRRARKKPPPLVLEPGAKLVVETLSTSSTADVVWQVYYRYFFTDYKICHVLIVLINCQAIMVLIIQGAH